MRIILILPLLIMLACSCSSERRLQRLIDRNPHLRDTVVVTLVDTVIVPGDTVTATVTLHDTVTVESERQVVRIVRVPTGSPCDTAAIALDVLGIVKADTVVATRTVEVPRIVPCPPATRVASWWRTAAIVLAVVLGLVLYLQRR